MVYKRQIVSPSSDIPLTLTIAEESGFFINSELAVFDNEAEKFSFANAWWMAEFCRVSYLKKKTEKRKILKDAGFPNVKFWSIEGTDCYIAHNKDTIVLAFTGTETDEGLEDVLIDAQFWPSKWDIGKGWIHSGFEKAILYVWEDVKNHIQSIIEGRKLWITGHSLGGALSILAASATEAQGTYAFGAPRVGSRKFTKSIKTPIYRVTKSRDIVTRVPTPPFYKHAGTLYFIGNNQKVLKNPTWSTMLYHRLGGTEWKIVWLLFKLIVFKSKIGFILSYIHDHNLYNYSVYMWNNLDSKVE